MAEQRREQPVEAIADWVSEKLFVAVFDDLAFAPDQPMEEVSVKDVIQHLVEFAVGHPEPCRIWLHEVLSSDRRSTDKFWLGYLSMMERFAASNLAQKGIDVELHSVMMIVGTIMWSVRARARARSVKERQVMAERFTAEMVRLAFNGTLRPEKFAELRRN